MLSRRIEGIVAPPTRQLTALLAAVTLVALSGGCARDRAARREKAPRPDRFVETVTERAPFDLSCPVAEVQVVKLSGASLGATGCGRRASYTCLCTYHVWFTCTQALCSLDGASLPPPAEAPAEPQPPQRPSRAATPIDASLGPHERPDLRHQEVL
jgi:hypothetical protein